MQKRSEIISPVFFIYIFAMLNTIKKHVLGANENLNYIINLFSFNSSFAFAVQKRYCGTKGNRSSKINGLWKSRRKYHSA